MATAMLAHRKGMTLQETVILVICVLVLIALAWFVKDKLAAILTFG